MSIRKSSKADTTKATRKSSIKHKEKSLQKSNKSVTSSMKFRITLLSSAAILLTVLLYSAMIIPSVKKNVTTINSNSLYDIAISYGQQLDSTISMKGNFVLSHPDALEAVVGTAGLEGMSSSYCYVVSWKGLMLYHPDAEKITQPVENSVITQIVSEVSAGTIPEPAVVTYDYNGSNKYAAYYVSESRYILVVTADEDDLLSIVNKLQLQAYMVSAVLLVIGIIASLLISGFMTRPLKKITGVIDKISVQIGRAHV